METNFDFNTTERKEIFEHIRLRLENFYQNTRGFKISSDWNFEAIRDQAKALDFKKNHRPLDAVNHVLDGLEKFAVHTPHPGYFGLFNPRPSFPSAMADLISAIMNPQLAAWSHAPFAVEIENYVVREFGKKFGYQFTDGTFCSGGAESNLTAIICAINHHFKDFQRSGVKGISKMPVIYCSTESHHSIVKAARITGLGSDAVVSIPVDENLRMDHKKLKAIIRKDRQNDRLPFMVIGTAGTTGSGAIDDLEALSKISRDENMWFHVDAAYGGAIIVSSQHRSILSGIELSDSITLDIHKWFSVPMGASLFLTSKENILHESFKIETDYMPEDGDLNIITNPYIRSIQWSRRFIGLKIYLPLSIFGWQGFEEIINKQMAINSALQSKLKDHGWDIINQSQLPITCFSHQEFKSNKSVENFVDKINADGNAWLSIYPIKGRSTIRVCITNYQTNEDDLDQLIQILNQTKNTGDGIHF